MPPGNPQGYEQSSLRNVSLLELVRKSRGGENAAQYMARGGNPLSFMQQNLIAMAADQVIQRLAAAEENIKAGMEGDTEAVTELAVDAVISGIGRGTVKTGRVRPYKKGSRVAFDKGRPGSEKRLLPKDRSRRDYFVKGTTRQGSAYGHVFGEDRDLTARLRTPPPQGWPPSKGSGQSGRFVKEQHHIGRFGAFEGVDFDKMTARDAFDTIGLHVGTKEASLERFAKFFGSHSFKLPQGTSAEAFPGFSPSHTDIIDNTLGLDPVSENLETSLPVELRNKPYQPVTMRFRFRENTSKGHKFLNDIKITVKGAPRQEQTVANVLSRQFVRLLDRVWSEDRALPNEAAREEAMIRLRQVYLDQGVRAIPYINSVESANSVSWIILDPKHVKNVTTRAPINYKGPMQTGPRASASSGDIASATLDVGDEVVQKFNWYNRLIHQINQSSPAGMIKEWNNAPLEYKEFFYKSAESGMTAKLLNVVDAYKKAKDTL